MADWSAARAQPLRLFMHDLLVAEISHPAGVGGASFDPGQSFARGLLRPYLLRLCGSRVALWRSNGAAWPLRHPLAGDYLYRIDPGGRSRGSAQTKAAPFFPDGGSKVGLKTG